MAASSEIRAGRAFIEIGADSRDLEEKVKHGMGLIHQLHEGLGAHSTLGSLGHILEGAGAVAGLGISARLLKDMGENALKWKEAMDSGAKSSGDVTEELLKSLPVLGDIYTAGRAIRELFDGEEAATKAITEEVGRLNSLMDAHQKIVEAGAKGYEEALAALSKMRAEATLIGTSGPWRDFLQSQVDFAAAQDQIRKSSEAAAKAIREAATAKLGGDPERMRAALVGKLQGGSSEEIQAQIDALRAQQEMSGEGGGVADIQRQIDALEALASQRTTMESELSAIEANIKARDAALAKLPTGEQLNQAFASFIKQGVAVGESFAEKFWDAFQKEADKRAKDLADTMKREGERFEKEIAGFGPPEPIKPEFFEPELIKGIKQTLANFTAIGTTNPFVAGQLGSGGGVSDIAKNTRDTAAALRRIEQRGGITYK